MPISLSDLFSKIKGKKAFIPERIRIPDANVVLRNNDALNVEFVPHEQYFIVRVNELFLSYDREWFTTYDPMVFSLSEFQYGTDVIKTPFLVGPEMLQSHKDKIKDAKGFIFKDTKVAGLHPYRGGEFSLMIVLGRLRQNNYLRKFMTFIQETSSVFSFGFSPIIDTYTAIANKVLDSFDTLLDNKDVEPLIGYRLEYAPDAQSNFSTGYFAMFNAEENKIDPNNLYVVNNELRYGESKDKAVPFRTYDYVLYSIMKADRRSDTEILPYHKKFTELQTMISDMPGEIGKNEKTLINGKLYALQDAVRMSSDLIRPQMREEIKDYREQVRELIDERQPLGGEGFLEGKPKGDWDKEMDAISLELLKS